MARLPELRYFHSHYLDDEWIEWLPAMSKLIDAKNESLKYGPSPASLLALLDKARHLERLSIQRKSLNDDVIEACNRRPIAGDVVNALRFTLSVQFHEEELPPSPDDVEMLKRITVDSELRFAGPHQKPVDMEIDGYPTKKLDVSGTNRLVVRNCPDLEEVRVWSNQQLDVASCPRLTKLDGQAGQASSHQMTKRIARITSSPMIRTLSLVGYDESDVEDCPTLYDLRLDSHYGPGGAAQRSLAQATLRRIGSPGNVSLRNTNVDLDDPQKFRALALNADHEKWYELLERFPNVRMLIVHSIPRHQKPEEWEEVRRRNPRLERLELSLLDNPSGSGPQISPDLTGMTSVRVLRIVSNHGWEAQFVDKHDRSLLPSNLEILVLQNSYRGRVLYSDLHRPFRLLKRHHPRLLVIEESELETDVRRRFRTTPLQELTELSDPEAMRRLNADWWQKLRPAHISSND
ncbi:MAG: hypothetical protein QM811_30695 [Pirellulales bacterium]